MWGGGRWWAWAFLLLLSSGQGTEVTVVKQMHGCFVQTEGAAKAKWFQFNNGSRRNGNSPGKVTGFGFVSSSDVKEEVNSFQGLILKEGERVAWMRWTQIKTVLSQGRICQWNDNSHIYIVGAYLFQTKSWKHVKARWHITKPVLSSCLSLYRAVNIG